MRPLHGAGVVSSGRTLSAWRRQRPDFDHREIGASQPRCWHTVGRFRGLRFPARLAAQDAQ